MVAAAPSEALRELRLANVKMVRAYGLAAAHSERAERRAEAACIHARQAVERLEVVGVLSRTILSDN